MIKADLCLYLEEMLMRHADSVLAENGLTRRKRAKKYSRKIESGRQFIEFTIRAPRYSDDSAIGHVSANVLIDFPCLESALQAMLGDVSTLFPGKDVITIGNNIGLLGSSSSVETWRPASAEDFAAVGADMTQHVVDYVLPFLNQYSTLSAIAHGHNDSRFLRTEAATLQFAAAALCVRENVLCRYIVENAFGSKKRLQRRYAAALRFVASLDVN